MKNENLVAKVSLSNIKHLFNYCEIPANHKYMRIIKANYETDFFSFSRRNDFNVEIRLCYNVGDEQAIKRISYLKNLAIILDNGISSLNLNLRERKTCERLGIDTIGDFIGKTKKDFISTRKCGKKTFFGINEKLKEKYGFNIQDSL